MYGSSDAFASEATEKEHLLKIIKEMVSYLERAIKEDNIAYVHAALQAAQKDWKDRL